MKLTAGLIPVFALAASLAAIKPAMAQERGPASQDPLAEDCRKLETRGQTLTCLRAAARLEQDHVARLNDDLGRLNQVDHEAAQAFINEFNTLMGQNPCASFRLAGEVLMYQLPLPRDPNDKLKKDKTGLREVTPLFLNDGSACIGQIGSLAEKHGFTETAGGFRGLATGMQQASQKLER